MQVKFDDNRRTFATYENAARHGSKLPADHAWMVMARADGRFQVAVIFRDSGTQNAPYLANNGYCLFN